MKSIRSLRATENSIPLKSGKVPIPEPNWDLLSNCRIKVLSPSAVLVAQAVDQALQAHVFPFHQFNAQFIRASSDRLAGFSCHSGGDEDRPGELSAEAVPQDRELVQRVRMQLMKTGWMP